MLAMPTDENPVVVIEGDCLDVLSDLPEGCIDMVLADPPYSVSMAGVTHNRQAGKGVRQYDFFEGDCDWKAMTQIVLRSAQACLPALTSSASMYWWVGHRQFGPLVDQLELSGFSTRFMVWSKKCPPPPAPYSGWPSGAELCVYAYRPGRTWNLTPKTTPLSNVMVADSFRHGQPGKVDHPTQKPTSIIRPQIKASCPDGGIVLNCYGGSGTTAVAAIAEGRRCIIIEQDPKYCDIIRQRVKMAMGGEMFAAVKTAPSLWEDAE